MMENYIKSCLKDAVEAGREDLDDVINNIVKYTK
jgi:DNA-binding FrmR family transcriptional regulator